MPKIVQQLMEKEVDRRQFLAHIGAGALMVIGVSGLIKSLTELGSSHKRVSGGYGSSGYGGGSDRGKLH